MCSRSCSTNPSTFLHSVARTNWILSAGFMSPIMLPRQTPLHEYSWPKASAARLLQRLQCIVPSFCLQNEQDLSTRRNAFQFLTNHDQQRAINYLLGQVGSLKP